MGMISNINSIHVNLKESFENVTISEKSDKKFGNYFELEVFSEGKKVKLLTTKMSLERNVFDWKYYSNPLDESSVLVERTSDVDTIVEHIKDIFDKKRFDENYLKNN